ncbi:MAG TPA: RsmB/NOP family class I SAM-dependent RNA methyltransferase [Candidatus Didemnitutus sp.]|nr:RsmB/NOP family class I SAM-dependent RNA methyltransferase [Candidatus Didemnitutus sp.]
MAESSASALAVRVLQLVADGTPADAALREALKRTRHRSAPAERRAVSQAIFAYFRWRQWLDARARPATQLAEAAELQARFDRSPTSFKSEALAARAVPAWLSGMIDWPDRTADGILTGLEKAWHRQLQREPALWLRVRRGREEAVGSELGSGLRAPGDAAFGAALAAPVAQVTSARLYAGGTDLFQTASFRAGDFEIQDLGSQVVGYACAPRPGETWWDACAGEGGKLLHLADQMQNKGLIWASDRSERRLRQLKERAARAQVFNYRMAAWDGSARLPTKTRFDGVLVDAPCSGIGTWQRNPHARWSTGPNDVKELAAVQQRLLDHVAPSLKPGGRLVYAVCTLTRAETSEVAHAFANSHPDFEPVPTWPGASNDGTFLWPPVLNANGMFIACWRRK